MPRIPTKNRQGYPRSCESCNIVIYNKTKWHQHQNTCARNNIRGHGSTSNYVSEENQPDPVVDVAVLPSTPTAGEQNITPDILNNEIANFAFNLKRRFFLEGTTIQYIMNFCSTMMGRLLSLSNTEDFVDNYIDRSFFRLQTKFLRENKFNSWSSCHPVQIEDSPFTYLPIRPQICQLLEKDLNLLKSFKKYRLTDGPVVIANDMLLSSTLDGRLSKQLLAEVESEYIIPIVLFFDEFTDVCPIGPFVDSNKMAVFQWRVLSRDFVSDCFLLAVANSSNLKKGEQNRKIDKLNTVIRELLVDVESSVLKLSNGVCCEIVVIGFCADNLAQHQIGGFFESFSAKFPCNRCMLPKKLFHLTYNENSPGVRRRTLMLTRQQISSICNADKSEKQRKMQSTGIIGVYPAVMNIPRVGLHFPDFFPTEIMHDILQDKLISVTFKSN